jgi:glycosyltransferase involved in cell wall biosynthesis
MVNPIISIIIPSLNQGEFLEHALQSILTQGYKHFELIIIDGGSTDKTLKIIQSYNTDSRIKWISEPDKGQSDALNKGFQMTQGDIIGWLNTDDLYLSGCFQTIARFFEEHDDIDIVYGDYCLINREGKIIKYRKEINFDLFILKYLHVLYIPSTSTFFRRKIIEENYLLRIDYHYAMDYDFFLRLALAGYKFAHFKQYLANFRWHENSKSATATSRQFAEREMSLLEQDRLINNIHPILLRKTIRGVFMVFARLKRTTLKIIQGCYKL